MKPLPWRYVASWNCIACGMCCRGFHVAVGFNEWVKIVGSYGVGVTEPGLDKFYLSRRSDGTCVFLYKLYDMWLCGLQHMKPKACKLWPFKVLDRPKYGRPNEASYRYKDRNFFVYVDPLCVGIRWGSPTQEFAYRSITELVEIVLGIREKQYYSTSRIPYRPRYFKVRGRKIV